MKIVQSNNQYFDKILRDKEGKLVRATFCVYESAGRVKARLINLTYLEERAITGKTSSLSSLMSKTVFDTQLGSSASKLIVSSPYFSKLTLYFNGSKPRAPTII